MVTPVRLAMIDWLIDICQSGLGEVQRYESSEGHPVIDVVRVMLIK